MLFKFDQDYFLNNQLELNVTLHKALDFLKDYMNDASLICTETNGFCYSALIFIGKAIYVCDIDFSIFTVKDFEMVVFKLLIYLYEIRNELKFEIRVNLSNAEFAKDKHEMRLFALSYTLFIANRVSRFSANFCSRFVQIQGLKCYFLFLADKQFMRINKVNFFKKRAQTLFSFKVDT